MIYNRIMKNAFMKLQKLSFYTFCFLSFLSCESASIYSSSLTKIIWVTNDGVGNGAFGSLNAADDFCDNDSNNPDTSASYKAMIAFPGQRIACTTANCTSTSENSNWVLTANTSYYRPDGTLIGTTNSGGIFTSLSNAIESVGAATYTGLTSNWTTGNTCNSWTNTAGVAHVGDSDSSNVSTLLANDAVGSCLQDLQLICVEQ